MPQLAPPSVDGATAAALDRHPRTPDPAPCETRCPNCGAASPRAYCPDCGQAQRDFHRPLHTFASDLFESLTGWDHKIPATFGLLLARPGALTREFLAGRRKRYLSPFQLYLLASALLFLALRAPLPGGQNLVRITRASDARGQTGLARPTATAGAPAAPPDTTRLNFAVAGLVRFYGEWPTGRPDAVPRENSVRARIARSIRERQDEIDRRSSTDASRWLEGLFLGHLGTALSLLVPVFACLCSLLWRSARLFYAEHVVFAWHTHAQGLMAIAAARVLPGRLAFVPTVWTLAYLWLATRRVYGTGRESRARTTGKVALLTVVYFVVAAFGLIATLLVSLLLGS